MNRPTISPVPNPVQAPANSGIWTRLKIKYSNLRSEGRLIAKIQEILFWTWNWNFMLFICFGMLPLVAPSIFMGFIEGEVNLNLFLFFATLTFLAPAAALAGFKKFRHNSKALFRILYGVEVPLLLLTFFRVIFLRELNPGVVHLLAVFALGSLAFFWALFKQPKETGVLVNSLRLAGMSLFLWCALWVFGFLIFLAPPVGWNIVASLGKFIVAFPAFIVGFIVDIFQSLNYKMILMLPTFLGGAFFLLVGAIFLIYTFTLFIALPFVYVYLGFSAFKKTVIDNWNGGRRVATLVVVSLVLLGNTWLFYEANEQGHAETFAQMHAFDNSVAAKERLLLQADTLREGLTDIYLSPYRYLGDASRSNSMQALYKKTFDMARETSKPIQSLFNAAATPFLYSGSGKGMAKDQQEAARLYEWFFDTTIQEGERDALRHALKATYSREQRDAGLINIDNKKVHLDQQTVNVSENGDWAEIEIHETYVNRGDVQEEVFYHFAMPENSVITGVWLGENETNRFRFQVASRGAAQKVYKEIQRQRQDPALMEQVGPNLYRLRVFPIPVNRLNLNRLEENFKTKKMHLWWKFKVLKTPQGWPMPRLIEKRNVYWDSKSQREHHYSSKDEWLPEYLSIKENISSQTLRAVVDEGVEIRATPKKQAEVPLRESGKFALVLETSYSMGKLRGALLPVKTHFAGDAQLSRYDWDYYRLGHMDKKVNSLDELFSPDTAYFGSVDAVDILSRFDALRQNRKYDGIIVLTDRSSFKEKERTADLQMGTEPFWFFLVDGQYPRVTGDALMRELIASGGGLETDWNRLANKLKFPLGGKMIAIDDRYVWTLHATEGKPQYENGFDDLAVKQFIQHRMKYFSVGETDRGILTLHELAKTFEIVTPYSSMIVLVNLAQKNMLKQAEEQADRFKRDMENGQEILSSPSKPFEVSAVPEPEEWALILIVLTLLLYRLYRNKENGAFQRVAY